MGIEVDAELIQKLNVISVPQAFVISNSRSNQDKAMVDFVSVMKDRGINLNEDNNDINK